MKKRIRIYGAVCIGGFLGTLVLVYGVVASKTHPAACLKDVYRHDFVFGTAVEMRVLNDPSAVSLILQHFNSVTIENSMKWNVIHPEETMYHFERADALVNFAHDHNMRVIGHTLIWEHNTRTPDWVFQAPNQESASPEQVLRYMRDHITTVMARYAGKVQGWDVVNEALDDPISNGEGCYAKKNRYKEILGIEYVAKAFEFAHQADPEAELYYNDYFYNQYSAYWDGKQKQTEAIALIRSLQERNLRIDGIGIQGHWTLRSPSVQELDEMIQRFAELGIQVMITELDIGLWDDDYGKFRELSADEQNLALQDKLQQQAERYAEVFRVFHTHREHISRVTLWGVSDAYSWRKIPSRGGQPLLFDEDGNPKPAFYSVLRVLTKKTP